MGGTHSLGSWVEVGLAGIELGIFYFREGGEESWRVDVLWGGGGG